MGTQKWVPASPVDCWVVLTGVASAVNLSGFGPGTEAVEVRFCRVRDGAFHFWDAVDDFSDVRMDLLFEGDRLYLHDASGKFGAVPLSMTGELAIIVMLAQYPPLPCPVSLPVRCPCLGSTHFTDQAMLVSSQTNTCR